MEDEGRINIVLELTIVAVLGFSWSIDWSLVGRVIVSLLYVMRWIYKLRKRRHAKPAGPISSDVLGGEYGKGWDHIPVPGEYHTLHTKDALGCYRAHVPMQHMDGRLGLECLYRSPVHVQNLPAGEQIPSIWVLVTYWRHPYESPDARILRTDAEALEWLACNKLNDAYQEVYQEMISKGQRRK